MRVGIDFGTTNSGVGLFDYQAMRELRGIRLVIADRRRHILRHFEKEWQRKSEERIAERYFPTIKSAMNAFQTHREQRSAPLEAPVSS